MEEGEFDFLDQNLVDADDFQYAEAQAQDEAFDVKDTAMVVESEHSESSINIINDFENFKAEGEIYSLAMNDKGILIIGDGEEYTYFYDVSMKKLIKKEKFNKDSVNHVKITVDNKYILTSSLDGTVNVFSSDTLELLRTVEGSFSEINVIIQYKNIL
jgi:WD40 repeat protein